MFQKPLCTIGYYRTTTYNLRMPRIISVQVTKDKLLSQRLLRSLFTWCKGFCAPAAARAQNANIIISSLVTTDGRRARSNTTPILPSDLVPSPEYVPNHFQDKKTVTSWTVFQLNWRYLSVQYEPGVKKNSNLRAQGVKSLGDCLW